MISLLSVTPRRVCVCHFGFWALGKGVHGFAIRCVFAGQSGFSTDPARVLSRSAPACYSWDGQRVTAKGLTPPHMRARARTGQETAEPNFPTPLRAHARALRYGVIATCSTAWRAARRLAREDLSLHIGVIDRAEVIVEAARVCPDRYRCRIQRVEGERSSIGDRLDAGSHRPIVSV